MPTARTSLINTAMRLFEIEKRNLHSEILNASDPRVPIRQIYREYILPHGYQPPEGLSEDEIIEKIYNYYFSTFQHQTDLTPRYMYRLIGVDENGEGEDQVWASMFYPILSPPGNNESISLGYKSEMTDEELWSWRGWRRVINSADEAAGGETEMIVRALFAIQHNPELNFEFYREMENAVHQMDNALHDGIVRAMGPPNGAYISGMISMDEYLKRAEKLPQMLRKMAANGWKQGRISQEESSRLIEIIDNAWQGLIGWVDAPNVKIERVDFQ